MNVAALLSFFAMFVGFVSGCASIGPVAGTKSEYFETKGAGFMLDLAKHEANYAIRLAVLKPLPVGVVIECRFENPRLGAPIVTEITDYAGKQELMIQSPTINTLGIKSYLFEAVVYADATKSKVITSHKQSVFSSIPF